MRVISVPPSSPFHSVLWGRTGGRAAFTAEEERWARTSAPLQLQCHHIELRVLVWGGEGYRAAACASRPPNLVARSLQNAGPDLAAADGVHNLSAMLSACQHASAPRIATYASFVMDVSGSDITLPCAVEGSPRPAVFWKDNNNQLITPGGPGARRNRYKVGHVGHGPQGQRKLEAPPARGADRPPTWSTSIETFSFEFRSAMESF